jgi:hypothetical protein
MAAGVPMSAQFWPCPGCSRHVKRGDAVCPFCGATARVDGAPTRVLAGRLSRAALFAAGTMGAAVATTDCCAQPPYGAGPPPGAVAYSTTGTEDASASDVSNEAAADAEDESATPVLTDSATTTDDVTSAADVSTDAGDESANESQPPWSIGQPAYGGSFPPDLPPDE